MLLVLKVHSCLQVSRKVAEGEEVPQGLLDRLRKTGEEQVATALYSALLKLCTVHSALCTLH